MQKLQRQCSTNWCVPPEVNLAQDYPPITLAANRRSLLAHPNSHVHLTNRRPDDDTSRRAHGVVYHAARREICYDLPGPVTQHEPCGQSEGVVLANRAPLLRYQGQPIDVRIDGEADRGTAPEHEPFQLAEVFSHRLGRTRKAPVRLEIDGDDLTTQSVQKRGHDDLAGAANTIQSDLEPPCANTLYVQVGNRQHTVEVSLNGTLILCHGAKVIPRRARDSGVHEGAHFGALLSLQE